MRRYLLTSCLVALPLTANSALFDRGNGLIYDEDRDITWLADANYAMTSGYDADGRMDWYEAMDWADQLVYAGFDQWRLPVNVQPDTSCSDVSVNTNNVTVYSGFGCVGGEMGHLFYEEFGGSENVSIYDLISASADPDLDLFDNLISSFFWTSTSYSTAAHPSDAWKFSFVDGASGRSPKTQATGHYAWAVHDGDIGAVPIPSAVWLFGSGLLGLIGMARRKGT